MEQNKAERLNENVTEKMCSSDGNVVGEMCSPADADTRGDGCFAFQGCPWPETQVLYSCSRTEDCWIHM